MAETIPGRSGLYNYNRNSIPDAGDYTGCPVITGKQENILNKDDMISRCL